MGGSGEGENRDTDSERGTDTLIGGEPGRGVEEGTDEGERRAPGLREEDTN